MACCNCTGCFVKTNAFIAALLSIAVLSFSIIVLISSVNSQNTESDDTSFNKSDSVNHPPSKVPSNTTTHEDNLGSEMTMKPDVESDHTDQEESITEKPSHPVVNESAISNDIEQFLSRNEFELDSEVEQNKSSPVSPIEISPTNTSALTDTAKEERNPSTSTISPKVEPSWNNFFKSHHDFWRSKTDTYVIIMQASSGTGIFAALLQLGFSWLVICGSNKDMKERTKLWNLSNFIVLILLVVIILVPASYNSSNDTFKGSGVFAREIGKRITSAQFYSKMFSEIPCSISQFLQGSLSLYYFVLGLDTLVLLAFLIPPILCCCTYPCRKSCCKKNKDEKSDSDIMLFGPGGAEWNL